MRTLIVLSLLSTSVYADRWHHEHENVTNVTEVTEITENITEVTENSYNTTEQADGVALAIANSQLNFDWATNDYQAGIGLGTWDDTDAVSFGVGKRFKGVLLNGSIGREGNKYGAGVGVNFRF